MSASAAIREDDLREKIQTVLSKLDKIESRVKNVEAVAAVVPKLEKTLSKVQEQVVSAHLKAAKPSPRAMSAPTPVKAFVSGASIGVVIVGAITAGWLLGMF